MDLREFGLNVAKKRILKNLSAYELSLRIEKDASYINKLENGKANATLKTVFRICEELEIEPAELFTRE